MILSNSEIRNGKQISAMVYSVREKLSGDAIKGNQRITSSNKNIHNEPKSVIVSSDFTDTFHEDLLLLLCVAELVYLRKYQINIHIS